MGAEQWGDNERALGQQEDAHVDGYHDENLFDQNENMAGETRDLRTGEAIRNDIDDDMSDLLEVDTKGKLIKMKEGLKKDQTLTVDQKKLQEIADNLLKEYGSDELGTEPSKKKKAA